MRFFKVLPTRGFQHKPRFFNERKERIRILEEAHEQNELPYENAERYRERMRANWESKRKVKLNDSKGYITRMLVAFAILAALVVFANNFFS